MSDWGHLALWLALTCSGIQIIASVIALRANHSAQHSSVRLAKRALSVHTALIIIACIGIVRAFIKNDFSLLTVANHSHVDLPLFYKMTALWAGHEGSILLWLLVSSIYALFCTNQVQASIKKTSNTFYLWVIFLFGLIQVSFLIFCLFTSNPFAPSQPQGSLPYTLFGSSLNPILQDPLMAIHPPILYLGYVGAVAPCILILAYLITASPKKSHTQTGAFKHHVFVLIKNWMLIAWSFLTLGIGLGSFWAYYELGWGGFWFWDPVENASLMPWLLMVGAIHILNASIKYHRFYRWSAGLAIACFCSTLIGTFTVRSGLLSSVHSFSNDPSRGAVLLVIIAVFCTLSVLAFLYRFEQLDSCSKKPLSGFNQANALLLNALIFIAACFTVAVGTLTPIFYGVAFDQAITVGAPYFNTFLPYFMIAILFVMVLTSIKTTSFITNTTNDKKTTRWPAVIVLVCLCTVIVFLFTSAQYKSMSLWANGLTAILISAFFIHTWPNIFTRNRPNSHHKNLHNIYKKLPMHAAHAGFMVMCIGIILSSAYGVQSHQQITKNKPFNVAGQTFIWKGTHNLQSDIKQPRYQLHIDLIQSDKTPVTLSPEKRIYPERNTVTSEAAIHSQWSKDVYIVLGQNINEKTWIVNVQYKPMIRYLWMGVIMMALAGLIGATKNQFKPS